jgi:hypothetical protein
VPLRSTLRRAEAARPGENAVGADRQKILQPAFPARFMSGLRVLAGPCWRLLIETLASDCRISLKARASLFPNRRT